MLATQSSRTLRIDITMKNKHELIKFKLKIKQLTKTGKEKKKDVSSGYIFCVFLFIWQAKEKVGSESPVSRSGWRKCSIKSETALSTRGSGFIVFYRAVVSKIAGIVARSCLGFYK